MVNKLFDELAQLPQIEAIALGGSRAGEVYDEKSDYDVYLYCNGEVGEEIRQQILEKYCSYMEIGNHFWEYEDNCTFNNGIDIDILYRNLDDFTAGVAAVVEGGQAYNGYTTCMWHNLLTCRIIYDRDGRLEAAKKRFQVPYPNHLKNNIIDQNMRLLHRAMPAYNLQIKKAVERKDLVSINHRTAAFMESYFDVIFALNEVTHPGEKRLMQLARKKCSILPEHFEENVESLFAVLFTNPDKIASILTDMVEKLENLLEK